MFECASSDYDCLSRDGNQQFRDTMATLENHPRVKGLSFTSFLILPFQRITRLKLLVQVSLPTLLYPSIHPSIQSVVQFLGIISLLDKASERIGWNAKIGSKTSHIACCVAPILLVVKTDTSIQFCVDYW